MFWQNNYAPSVQIELLLNNEDISLTKLMDADDILQECKNQNKKLIEFLIKPNILEELVNLITEEPCTELEERLRYKYSNVACELLTCDVPVLTEKIAGNEMLLAKLYSFIDKDEPLNPLLASFFSKTLHALLRRASDQNWFSHQFVCLQVLESLKSRKNCVDLLLQHIETSAIMDLIFILLTKIEGYEMRHNILNWLNDQNLIQKLVDLLSPLENSEKHTNVSQLLCDVIKLPQMEPEKQPDPILKTLKSEETIKRILDTILTEEKAETSIVGGLRILINLLGQKESKKVENNDTYGTLFLNFVKSEERVKFALVILPYLKQLNQLLLDPPKKPAVKTTAAYLKKPFGKTRLYILKLYVTLLSTDNAEVFLEFIELDTYNILLDLFFEYEWNNFLHTQVQHCVTSTINCSCLDTIEIIFTGIFVKGRLLDRILEAWKNDEKSNLHSSLRQGYIGHLVAISNEIVTGYEENNVLSNFFKTNLSEELTQKWENFVSTQLDEINKKQLLSLGDLPENYLLSSSGISEQYSSFPENSYGQDIYANYTDNDFHFQVENFNDEEDFYQNSSGNSNKSFTDNFEKSQELFHKICSEKSFDSSNKSDHWGFETNFSLNNSDWISGKKDNSSSSDDDNNDDDNVKEPDDDDSDYLQKENEDKKDACIETNVDPWDSFTPSTAEKFENDNWEIEQLTGWANFDHFDCSLSSGISTNKEKTQNDMPIEEIKTCYASLQCKINDEICQTTVEEIRSKVDDSLNKIIKDVTHSTIEDDKYCIPGCSQ